jgi:hypothetical protein
MFETHYEILTSNYLTLVLDNYPNKINVCLLINIDIMTLMEIILFSHFMIFLIIYFLIRLNLKDSYYHILLLYIISYRIFYCFFFIVIRDLVNIHFSSMEKG